MAAHLSVILERGAYASANARIFGQVPEEVRKRHYAEQQAYGAYWNELITDAQRAGELRPGLDPYVVRMLLFGAMNWAAEWYRPSRGRPPAVIVEHLLTIALDGLRTGTAGEATGGGATAATTPVGAGAQPEPEPRPGWSTGPGEDQLRSADGRLPRQTTGVRWSSRIRVKQPSKTSDAEESTRGRPCGAGRAEVDERAVADHRGRRHDRHAPHAGCRRGAADVVGPGRRHRRHEHQQPSAHARTADRRAGPAGRPYPRPPGAHGARRASCGWPPT